MGAVYNIYEAKTHLSKLVERAASGEEIVIAKAGKPVARLTAVEPEKKQRPAPGILKGKIWIADDFDDPLPDEILKAFEGDL